MGIRQSATTCFTCIGRSDEVVARPSSLDIAAGPVSLCISVVGAILSKLVGSCDAANSSLGVLGTFVGVSSLAIMVVFFSERGILFKESGDVGRFLALGRTRFALLTSR